MPLRVRRGLVGSVGGSLPKIAASTKAATTATPHQPKAAWASVATIRATISMSAPAAISRISHAKSRSEEHTSELQSLMRISYAVFCLKQQTTPHALAKHRVAHTEPRCTKLLPV